MGVSGGLCLPDTPIFHPHPGDSQRAEFYQEGENSDRYIDSSEIGIRRMHCIMVVNHF